VDNADRWAARRGRRLYTGQNREGLDSCVSERHLESGDHRLAVAGQAVGNTVEVGFEDSINRAFVSIVFRVRGAHLVR
jgi:hypothetical protein